MSIYGKSGISCVVVSLALLINTPVSAFDSLNLHLQSDWTTGGAFDGDYGNSNMTAFESLLGKDQELWLSDNWGLQGSYYWGEFENTGVNDAENLSLDIKRRFLTITDKTFLAVGLGWQDIDLHIGGTSSGPRVLLEGRWGFNNSLSLFGSTAWLPYLDDITAGSDVAGNEFEAGVAYDPLPYLSFRAGYRRFDLSYDNNGASGNTSSSGLMLGAGIRF